MLFQITTVQQCVLVCVSPNAPLPALVVPGVLGVPLAQAVVVVVVVVVVQVAQVAQGVVVDVLPGVLVDAPDHVLALVEPDVLKVVPDVPHVQGVEGVIVVEVIVVVDVLPIVLTPLTINNRDRGI